MDSEVSLVKSTRGHAEVADISMLLRGNSGCLANETTGGCVEVDVVGGGEIGLPSLLEAKI